MSVFKGRDLLEGDGNDAVVYDPSIQIVEYRLTARVIDLEHCARKYKQKMNDKYKQLKRQKDPSGQR